MTAWSPERPPWQAQIRRTRQALPVGAGLLCTDSHVVTCAHVIASNGGAPAGPVFITFQFTGHHDPIRATVIDNGWHPEGPDGSGDIVVLALERALPPGAGPAPLRDARRVWEHKFRAYGYPKGHERNGVWSHGMMVGHAGHEWIQLEADSRRGHQLQKGFSGAPIWDDQLEAVVGIVVTMDKVVEARTGYGIPVEVIRRYWPLLTSEAGRRLRHDQAPARRRSCTRGGRGVWDGCGSTMRGSGIRTGRRR